MGWVVIATGIVVLTLWIPLRQRPGLGTVLNAVVVGAVFEAVATIVPDDIESLPTRVGLLTLAIIGNGLATAAYIGAGLGPGPRDGLMTGLAARGYSIRVMRTAIEVTVLTIGWLLGGSVGVGTVAFALLIGPSVHLFLAPLTIHPARRTPSEHPA